MRGNYVAEVAKLVLRLCGRGYCESRLWRQLRYHLRRYPGTFGDTSFHALLRDAVACYNHLLGVQAAGQDWDAGFTTDWSSSGSRLMRVHGDLVDWVGEEAELEEV